MPFASIPDADAALRAPQGIGGPSEERRTGVWFSGHVEGEQGLKLFEHARALNLEGIVSKRGRVAISIRTVSGLVEDQEPGIREAMRGRCLVRFRGCERQTTGGSRARNDDFVAFDGDVVIGRVLQGTGGPDRGSWTWSVTVDLPGPRLTARSGETRRGDAARRVVEAYEKLLRSRRAPYRTLNRH